MPPALVKPFFLTQGWAVRRVVCHQLGNPFYPDPRLGGQEGGMPPAWISLYPDPRLGGQEGKCCHLLYSSILCLMGFMAKDGGW